MSEDFKKWLCEKSGHHYLKNFGVNELEILIKAMWAINREGEYIIYMHEGVLIIDKYTRSGWEPNRMFDYDEYNNSEQTALQKALEYIYQQTKE